MEIEKDKKIVIVTSGVFLCLLAVMLFVTLMRRDNMIGSTPHRGSTSELNMGDTSDDCATYTGSSTYYCTGNKIEYNGHCYDIASGVAQQEVCTASQNIWATGGQCLNASSETDRVEVRLCATCHAGYRLSNGVCYACNNGYWSEGGEAAACDACPTGYTCSNGSKYVSAPCCIEGETTQDPQACREDTSAVPGNCSSPVVTPTPTPTSSPEGSNYTCYYVHNGSCISDEFLVPCDQVTDVEAYSSLTACSSSVPADCCYQSGGSGPYTYARVPITTCQGVDGEQKSQTSCLLQNCQVTENVAQNINDTENHQEYLSSVSNTCQSCPVGMRVKNGSCSGTEANCCEDSEAPNNLTCYYTQNECNPTSPPGNACNNSSGYYGELSDCVSNLTCPTGKYKTSSGCSRCENGTQLRSDNCTGTQDTCCEETASTCSVSNCKTCSSNNNNVCTKCNSNYKLVQGRCVLVTAPCCVDNTTTYTDDATCQAKINSTDPHYIVSLGECSTCSVPNCHTCLSNANNKCGICDNDYILNSEGQCVHIEGECCSPSGTKGETECRTLANSGVNISLGACGISSISGDQSINITPSDSTSTSTKSVSTTYSAFDTLGNIIYSDLTWTISGDGVEKHNQYCKNGICTVIFHHQGTETCGPYVSFATITASKGNSSKTVNVTVNSYCDWEETQGTYTFSEQKYTRDAMKYKGGCLAYEGETFSNGQYQYTRRYDRCCGCGGGGSDPTPTPTPSKQKYCYIKLGNATDNDYCYDYAENCTGYMGPITKSSCGEAEACYLVNGQYKMGKFDGQGYMYVGTTCPKTEQKYCYVKYGNGTPNTYCYNTPSICTGYDETIYGKDNTNCGENDACYREDSTGSYVIGKFNRQTGYTYYGVTCPNNSNPACYKKPNGDYYWTDKPNDDDIEITSITDEDKCQTPSDDEKCYKDTSDNTYHWSKISEADPGWTEQTGVSRPEDCNDEDPACYKKTSTGEYDWGKYKNVIGWQPVTGVSSENACKRPDPACYTDPKGKYVWGNYEDDIQYTKVNGISSYDECMKSSPVIPVPKTALDRFKVIYVTVCIFALAGAGLIVYSRNKKITLIKKD